MEGRSLSASSQSVVGNCGGVAWAASPRAGARRRSGSAAEGRGSARGGARLPDPAARQRHDEPGRQVGTSRALSSLPRSGPEARAGIPQGRAAPSREILAERGACQAVAGPGHPRPPTGHSDRSGAAGGGSGPPVCPGEGRVRRVWPWEVHFWVAWCAFQGLVDRQKVKLLGFVLFLHSGLVAIA